MIPPKTINVLIVDDSAFMRRAIASMLRGEPGISVVGEACDGVEGLEKATRLRPDVMTLDVEMPRMDGLNALSRIMDQCPTHVIMLSSLTTEGSHAAMTALNLGAAEVMAKDSSQVSLTIGALKDELVAKVRALGASRRPLSRRSKLAKIGVAPTGVRSYDAGRFDLVAIGSSTGGPPVVEAILSALPPTFAVPIVVAQHMPEMFTRSMAERLAGKCALRVLHAEQGMPLEARSVYIAPGGKNTHVRKVGAGRFKLEINREPAGTIYYPSVDALLTSVAETVGSRGLGVVLTGMGDDGLRGARLLRAKGGEIIAQDEESCVVYGMPRAVTVAGVVSASLPPASIIASLCTLAGPGTASFRAAG